MWLPCWASALVSGTCPSDMCFICQMSRVLYFWLFGHALILMYSNIKISVTIYGLQNGIPIYLQYKLICVEYWINLCRQQCQNTFGRSVFQGISQMEMESSLLVIPVKGQHWLITLMLESITKQIVNWVKNETKRLPHKQLLEHKGLYFLFHHKF